MSNIEQGISNDEVMKKLHRIHSKKCWSLPVDTYKQGAKVTDFMKHFLHEKV